MQADLDWYPAAGTGSHLSHSPYLQKKIEVRVAVLITCSLSIIGSLLIILSYVCFRSLRTRARLILVHISVMDLGVAAANLVGAAVYFDQYYRNLSCLGPGVTAKPFMCQINSSTINGLCVAQGFIATYCTFGSILWTVCLSVYLYFLIVHHQTRFSQYTLWFSYGFCYVMPLVLTIWLTATNRIGYAPYDSSGWCSIIDKDPTTGYRSMFVSLVGYDFWIYLTFVLVPILSITTHMYIRSELKKSKSFCSSKRFWQALQNIDYKFLMIPVAFIVLRVWTCIASILFDYMGWNPLDLHKAFSLTLIILSGIGDSGQGATNAILFVLLSRKVRQSFFFCRCREGLAGDRGGVKGEKTSLMPRERGRVADSWHPQSSLKETPTTPMDSYRSDF